MVVAGREVLGGGNTTLEVLWPISRTIHWDFWTWENRPGTSLSDSPTLLDYVRTLGKLFVGIFSSRNFVDRRKIDLYLFFEIRKNVLSIHRNVRVRAKVSRCKHEIKRCDPGRPPPPPWTATSTREYSCL